MNENDYNNEIKILIDALKYTSNIIVDLTNKLTSQEEKINNLENKILKIQKLTMENNIKLKSININKIYEFITNFENNNNVIIDNNDNISEFLVENNNYNKKFNNKYDNYKYDNNKSNNDKSNNDKSMNQSLNLDKNKIDKLICSIVKRKNLLEEKIENKNVLESKIDYVIETGKNETNERDENSKYVETKSNKELTYYEQEQEKITNAQNNDLNKANNILKQIRKRSNFARKF